MNKSVYSPVAGAVRLTDSDFIAKGGQAAVYQKGPYAYKLYHDPAWMIPLPKIAELQAIQSKDVLLPLDAVYDKGKRPIGYIMPFYDGGSPLCRLFTKRFKKRNGLTPADVAELVKHIQLVLTAIHEGRCLAVDVNEANVLASPDFKTSVFLDTDNYETPNYRAQFLSESVRDPQVRNREWTELSDWFSFGVVVFQLYVGIHPYRGVHPAYQDKDWRKRMDDGVSVFDPDVQLPTACSDFGVIPDRHLEWFKEVFGRNGRSVPPLPDAAAPVAVPVSVRVIRKGGVFDVQEVFSLPEPICAVYSGYGITYALTKGALWKGRQQVEARGQGDVYVVFAGADMVILRHLNGVLRFELNGKPQTEPADRVLMREGRLYTMLGDGLFEHIFRRVGSSLAHSKRRVTTLMPKQVEVYDGVIIQTTIDKTLAILPFGQGRAALRLIPELDDYRIVDAKAQGHVMVVVGQRKGVYDRLVFCFAPDMQKYTVRVEQDIPTLGVNFTVLPSGVCVLVSGDAEIELFKDNSSVRKVPDPPFDESMALFGTVKGLHFVDGNGVYRARMVEK